MTRNGSFFKHPTETLEEYIKCLKGSLNPLSSRYSLKKNLWLSLQISWSLSVFLTLFGYFKCLLPASQTKVLKYGYSGYKSFRLSRWNFQIKVANAFRDTLYFIKKKKNPYRIALPVPQAAHQVLYGSIYLPWIYYPYLQTNTPQMI